MLDRSRSRDRSKTGGAFSPAGLFVTGAQGAWYDPSDFSTLFQNSTGTTPVTAVEQPVRLMLDRSRGLVLGPELVTNGDFSGGTTGWTQTPAGFDSATVVSGAVRITTAGVGAAAGLTQALTLIVGRSYLATGKIRSVSGAAVRLAVTNNAFSSVIANGDDVTSTTFTDVRLVFTATEVNNLIYLRVGAVPGIGEFDNISVRELPGNHALAPNDASRPVLRARYNQLTFSEQFDNAVWAKTGTTITANAAVAPDGTMTADKMVEVAAASTPRVGFGSAATIISAVYTLSVYAQAAERDQIRIVLEGSGSLGPYFLLTGAGSVSGAGSTTSSITNVGNGWYRCVVTYTAGATNPSLYIATASGGAVITSGDNTKGVLLWGAQLLTAADAAATGNAYQRIAAATDYDTSNPVWRPYLAFDGSDDHMVLASAINITTDMTVVRGFGRSAAGITSLGMGRADATVRHDLFWFGFNSTRYTALGDVQGNWAASTSTGSFVSTTARNATEEKLRLNGTAVSSAKSPGAVSSGFTAVGRYDVNYNNGPIYGLIVLDRELTGSELTATEQWMAGKTGVTI